MASGGIGSFSSSLIEGRSDGLTTYLTATPAPAGQPVIVLHPGPASSAGRDPLEYTGLVRVPFGTPAAEHGQNGKGLVDCIG
jgi:hypothetical protein